MLRGRTFSAPRKSMRGKGRITVQFGCCYNYAVDKQGRAPGEIISSASRMGKAQLASLTPPYGSHLMDMFATQLARPLTPANSTVLSRLQSGWCMPMCRCHAMICNALHALAVVQPSGATLPCSCQLIPSARQPCAHQHSTCTAGPSATLEHPLTFST